MSFRTQKRKRLNRPDGRNYHFAAIYAFLGDEQRAVKYLSDYASDIVYVPSLYGIIPVRFAQSDIMFENLWENDVFRKIIAQDEEEKATAVAELKELEQSGELESQFTTIDF